MTPTALSKRAGLALFFVITAGILALELPWLSRPPFEYHSYRQSQTLSTIELFAREGIDLTRAKVNYMGEPGYFVLELPLFQGLCALLYQWFGAHVWLVRSVNLLFTFANGGLTFLIGRRLFGREAGFVAMMAYLCAPLNLIYMGSTLLDLSATCASLAAFLLALRVVRPAPAEGPAPSLAWLALALFCLVTALIKTLYLFPVCLLLGATFLAERKLSARLLGAGACVLVSGAVFFLWLRHGQKINNASYFTRGISATSLIGFESLLRPLFYKEIIRLMLFNLSGPVGTLFSVFGLWAAFARGEPENRGARFPLVMLVLIVIGYYLLFSRANAHDYYSLAIMPYACVIAGFGAAEAMRRAARAPSAWRGWLTRPGVAPLLIAVTSMGMFVRPVLSGKQWRIAPRPSDERLRTLSRGQFEPYAYGMIFVAPAPGSPPPKNITTDCPEVLYATGLRGTARLAATPDSALAIWNDLRPHYKHLKYVVFYNLQPPPEIIRECRQVIAADEAGKWFACRVDGN